VTLLTGWALVQFLASYFQFTTRICGKATSHRFDVSSMVGARSFAKSILLEQRAIGDRSDPKTGKAYLYLVTIYASD